MMVKLREGSLPALTAGPRQRRGCPPGPGRPLGAAAHPAAGLSMLPQCREEAVMIPPEKKTFEAQNLLKFKKKARITQKDIEPCLQKILGRVNIHI